MASLPSYSQEGCSTISIPFDIEDSTELAKQAPFGLDGAESLIFLQRNGYN
ncbi:MAG: hypothetical protein M3512_07930 [Bacteroidota bacterium]|nr:hypothetical protein [Bacteroidota bacterium]